MKKRFFRKEMKRKALRMVQPGQHLPHVALLLPKSALARRGGGLVLVQYLQTHESDVPPGRGHILLNTNVG